MRVTAWQYDAIARYEQITGWEAPYKGDFLAGRMAWADFWTACLHRIEAVAADVQNIRAEAS